MKEVSGKHGRKKRRKKEGKRRKRRKEGIQAESTRFPRAEIRDTRGALKEVLSPKASWSPLLVEMGAEASIAWPFSFFFSFLFFWFSFNFFLPFSDVCLFCCLFCFVVNCLFPIKTITNQEK